MRESEVIRRSADGAERHRYRGYEFVIERGAVMWWCHQGIRVPHVPDPRFPKFDSCEWSLCGISHEAGWGSWSRRAILRKLTRCVDKDIARVLRRGAMNDEQPDARWAKRVAA